MPSRAHVRIHGVLFGLLVTILVPSTTMHAAVVSLTSCGTVVVGRAELTADLDCSAYPGHALVLDGTLALNGFTLTGNTTDPGGYSAVDCTGKCRVKIKGPGTIVGGATAVSGSKVLLTKEITVRDAGEWAVVGATVRVVRCHLHSSGASLAVGPDGGGGIRGGRVAVVRSTIENNTSFGIDANVDAALNFVRVMGHPVADVRSFEKPRASKTTCLVSRRANLTETWGICAND